MTSLRTLAFSRLTLFACAILLVSLNGFCSNDKRSSERLPLTEEELYLVKSYVSIASARAYYGIDSVQAESLFTRLDSTIDSSRISNTIKALNAEPDRWALIFAEIEKALQDSLNRGNLE